MAQKSFTVVLRYSRFLEIVMIAFCWQCMQFITIDSGVTLIEILST